MESCSEGRQVSAGVEGPVLHTEDAPHKDLLTSFAVHVQLRN